MKNPFYNSPLELRRGLGCEKTTSYTTSIFQVPNGGAELNLEIIPNNEIAH
jgi:hypothetical protein